jgi:hypothetical protein
VAAALAYDAAVLRHDGSSARCHFPDGVRAKLALLAGAGVDLAALDSEAAAAGLRAGQCAELELLLARLAAAAGGGGGVEALLGQVGGRPEAKSAAEARGSRQHPFERESCNPLPP